MIGSSCARCLSDHQVLFGGPPDRETCLSPMAPGSESIPKASSSQRHGSATEDCVDLVASSSTPLSGASAAFDFVKMRQRLRR